MFFLPLAGADEPVALLFDESTEEPLGCELVRFIWNDETLPDSSVFRLIEWQPGITVSWPSGDSAPAEVRVIPIGLEPNLRSNAILTWLEQCEAAAETAVLVLEPLDPNLTLTNSQRTERRDALQDHRYQLRFRVDDPTRAALRSEFADDGVYRFVRDALANPTTEDGLRLYQVLTEGDIVTARF